MAVRKIIKQGHPALKGSNAKVIDFHDPRVSQLVTDLIETMRDADLIGIAAPQIAENFRVFITEPRKTDVRVGDQIDDLRVYINPRIVSQEGEDKLIFEGCGCVDDKFGPVWRKSIVTVEAFDQMGQKFRLTADGILGRVILHECDHLNGLEFTNHTAKSELISKRDYIDTVKVSEEQMQNSIITVKKYEELPEE